MPIQSENQSLTDPDNEQFTNPSLEAQIEEVIANIRAAHQRGYAPTPLYVKLFELVDQQKELIKTHQDLQNDFSDFVLASSLLKENES